MDQTIKRIAVFSSGGDAPGMNAAIRAVVRTATYNDLHIYGIYRGFEGMINGEIERLETSHVANIIHRGGTILKTARSEGFRTAEGRKLAYESLVAQDIDACIAIGGNGTFTGAQIFSEEYNILFIGVPVRLIMNHTEQTSLSDSCLSLARTSSCYGSRYRVPYPHQLSNLETDNTAQHKHIRHYE